jgi:hypothetical protein
VLVGPGFLGIHPDSLRLSGGYLQGERVAIRRAGVRKRFGDVVAVDGVDLSALPPYERAE